MVTAANVPDRDGAKGVLTALAGDFPRLQKLWAAGRYRGELLEGIKRCCGYDLEIVERPPDVKGFQGLPRRWGVERTLAWAGNYRRLSKEYEYPLQTSEAMVYLVMIRIMLRRLARNAPC